MEGPDRSSAGGAGGGASEPANPPRRSARGILLLLLLLVIGVMGVQLIQVLRMRQANSAGGTVGDGKDPGTYGFDLSMTLVPGDEIVASGMPKNALKAMYLPAVIPPDALEPIRRARHSAYLVPGDRVIGVVIGGRARAYPIRVMNWHEVVNDTLDGRAIAVTYSPLCDAVVVFDRNVKGETLRFGVSGLLYNSNTLMYDVRPRGGKESLWSQLQCRAITGPAAIARDSLATIPSFLGWWRAWQQLHPATTILAPEGKGMYERYKIDVYGSYFDTQRLRFPVRPLPPSHDFRGRIDFQSRVEVDSVGRAMHVPAQDVHVRPPPTAVVHSLYFAWYAMHPGQPLSNVRPGRVIPPIPPRGR